jgi:hypothetical protein
MKKIKLVLYLLILMGMFSCDSFDFVYLDKSSFNRQVYLFKNGFVSVVLQIDPTKKNTSEIYVAPGRITKEKIVGRKTLSSSELIQMISDIIRRNKKPTGKEWHPTYQVYIKYTDRFLFVIPSKKYALFIFDFKNSNIFIEGRKFEFSENEAEFFQKNLDSLLKD